MRGFVSAIHCFDRTEDCSASSRPACRFKRPARKPRFAVKRFEPNGIPPPDAITHYRRDVIGNAHVVTGTCCGSGSGD